MPAQYPPALRPGATIGLCATARAVTPQDIAPGTAWLQEEGYTVQVPASLFDVSGGFAGSLLQRTQRLQELLDAETVDAIWFVRGGYGTQALLPHLDFSRYLRRPKWLIGYSDLTSLLNYSVKLGICSVHGPVFREYSPARWQDFTRTLALLVNPSNSAQVPGALTYNAPCVGGNLTSLVATLGTPFAPDLAARTVLLEDTDEYLYRIHRSLIHLAQSIHTPPAGIVWGSFTPIPPNPSPYGLSLAAMQREFEHLVKCPVGNPFPAGHGSKNYPVCLGA